MGVRRKYDWTSHGYTFRLMREDQDEAGVWYGVHVRDRNTASDEWCGSLRFPYTDGAVPLIRDGGGTWLEVYHRATATEDLPDWQVSIEGCYAETRSIPARHAQSDYSDLQAANIQYNNLADRIEITIGSHVRRINAADKLF